MTEIINQLPLPPDIQYKIFIYLLGLEGTTSCRVFKNALIEYQNKNKKTNKKPKEFSIYKFLGTNTCGRQLEINEDNISSITYEIRIAQFDDTSEDNWTKGSIRNIRKYMWILQERFKMRYKMLYL